MHVSLNAYFYDPNQEKYKVGDVIQQKGYVTKIISEIKDNTVICKSSSGKKFEYTKIEMNFLPIYKKIALKPRQFVGIIYKGSFSKCYIHEIRESEVFIFSQYILSEDSSPDNIIRKFEINKTMFYLQSISTKHSIFVEIPKGQIIPRWYIKLDRSKTEIIEKEVSKHVKQQVSAIIPKEVRELLIKKIILEIPRMPYCRSSGLSISFIHGYSNGKPYITFVKRGMATVNILLSDGTYSYIVPKIKVDIVPGDTVIYIGKRINLPNIETAQWKVLKIQKALDNKNLDQCAIINDERMCVSFRKELKLFKSQVIKQNERETFEQKTGSIF